MKVQKVVRSDHDKEFVPFPTMEPPDVPLWAWLEAYRPAWAQGSESLLMPGPRSEPSNANSPRVVPGLHALFGPFKELSRRNCAGQE
jgi:hypothetical protein